MAKVTIYQNSKFASFLSILGYIGIIGAVYLFLNDEPGIGVGFLAAGIVLKILAAFISNMKAKKEAKQNQNV